MKKSHIGIIIVIVVLTSAFFFARKRYNDWTQESHYYAKLKYDAHNILEEIQQLQNLYHNKHQAYAKSILELINSSKKVSDKLKNNADAYPGQTIKKSYSGAG